MSVIARNRPKYQWFNLPEKSANAKAGVVDVRIIEVSLPAILSSMFKLVIPSQIPLRLCTMEEESHSSYSNQSNYSKAHSDHDYKFTS